MGYRVSKVFEMSKEELQQLYNQSETFSELMKKTNTTSYKTIRDALRNKGIDFSRLETVSKIRYNLEGNTFGYLYVLGIDKDNPRKSKEINWKCECKCGNIITTTTHSLIRGNTTSCGCRQKERASEANKKYNKYDLSGEYGIGVTTNTNIEFYFDLEDYDKIKKYAWAENDCGYIVSNNNQKPLYLHRVIMNCDKHLQVDHINHIKSDNRKNNLRICNTSENIRNRGLQSNNTSGYTGIRFIETRNKWIVRIKIYGETKTIGSFENLEDAIKARKEAEIKYFGEFRYKEEND